MLNREKKKKKRALNEETLDARLPHENQNYCKFFSRAIISTMKTPRNL